MAQAASGDKVKVHYRGTLGDGSEFDSSIGGNPLEVTIGDGAVIPGFEQALVGMVPGDTKTISLAAEEAYGAHRAEMVLEVEKTRFPDSITLEAGRVLELPGTNGHPMKFVIVEVNDTVVKLDANHPLAGKDLTFELKMVEIG
jgi:peptidylprolyl isomerase